MTDLPKTLSCRLKEEDSDIQFDLAKHESDKSARIKEIYRKGLLYEKASYEVKVKKVPNQAEPIQLLPADKATEKFFDNEEVRQWYEQAGITPPTTLVYSK